MVVTQGHRLFADELTRLAAEISDPRLSVIAAGVTAPLRVAVCGRRGVGRRTVAAALAAAGLDVVGQSDAEVTVQVIAEAVKPEDAAAVRAARRRGVLVVLNKSDLAGHCDVAAAAAATRTPAEPLSALFALAALDGRLDDRLWMALRRLAAHPADLRRPELFVTCPHPLPRPDRELLCAVLDLTGIERMLEPARRGASLAQARTVLRRLSGIDDVLARLAAVGAGGYHRRMSEAVARLAALAVEDSRIDEFLAHDATVAARMAAATAVLEVPGEPALRGARRWHAYRGAPLSATVRACAADIARGSLRAWASGAGL